MPAAPLPVRNRDGRVRRQDLPARHRDHLEMSASGAWDGVRREPFQVRTDGIPVHRLPFRQPVLIVQDAVDRRSDGPAGEHPVQPGEPCRSVSGLSAA